MLVRLLLATHRYKDLVPKGIIKGLELSVSAGHYRTITASDMPMRSPLSAGYASVIQLHAACFARFRNK